MCVRMWDYMHDWVNAASCEMLFLPSYRSRHSAYNPKHIWAKVCLNMCVSRDLIINERCSFAVCLNGGTEVPWAYFKWYVCCVFFGKYKSEQLWMSWSVYAWRVGMCVVCIWVARSTHEHEQVGVSWSWNLYISQTSLAVNHRLKDWHGKNTWQTLEVWSGLTLCFYIPGHTSSLKLKFAERRTFYSSLWSLFDPNIFSNLKC